jgi:hypothetical protein
MNTSIVCRSVLSSTLVVVASAVIAGSGEPPAPARGGQGGTPATISFRALTGEGQPITDLKAADVSVKVDNTPREIRSLDLVTLTRAAGAEAAPAAAPVPPPFATNGSSGASHRTMVILVDEESIAPGKEQSVRDAATHVLAGLAPADRVAVLSLRQGGPRSQLAADHEAARKALGSLGGYAAGNETSSDLQCRTSRLLQNLQGIFAAHATGAAGTVILFSTSVAALQGGQMARVGAATGSDLCELRTEHFTQLGAAAEASRANFYVVELVDGAGAPPASAAAGGLENLAGVTSGEMVRLSANQQSQMQRILQETSAYYVLTFDEGERGTQSRRLELTVARNNVTVRAPKELAAARGSKKAAGATPRDMIRSANAFTDLGLRAVAYSSRNPGDDKIRVLALFEPVDATVRLNAAMIGLYDKSGKLQAQWTAQGSDLASMTGIAALLVAPGTYRMRVAATDATGRAGAVDTDVSAAIIEAGPIHLGDLVLGKMAPSGPVPVMQFSTEEEAVAMVELYGRPSGPLTAYIELTTGGPGEPLQALPLSPSATSEPDKFILSAKLALTSLKPGDYLVRAVIGVQGKEGRITRTLRKVGG